MTNLPCLDLLVLLVSGFRAHCKRSAGRKDSPSANRRNTELKLPNLSHHSCMCNSRFRVYPPLVRNYSLCFHAQLFILVPQL